MISRIHGTTKRKYLNVVIVNFLSRSVGIQTRGLREVLLIHGLKLVNSLPQSVGSGPAIVEVLPIERKFAITTGG